MDVFSPEAGAFARPSDSDRRTWQIYRLVAPSLNLPPESDTRYPFSVKPEKKITLNGHALHFNWCYVLMR